MKYTTKITLQALATYSIAILGSQSALDDSTLLQSAQINLQRHHEYLDRTLERHQLAISDTLRGSLGTLLLPYDQNFQERSVQAMIAAHSRGFSLDPSVSLSALITFVQTNDNNYRRRNETVRAIGKKLAEIYRNPEELAQQAYPLLQNIYHLNEEHKSVLQRIADQFREEHRFSNHPPLLFYGPLGTGKAETALALSNELSCRLVEKSGFSLLADNEQSTVGNIQMLFDRAQQIRNSKVLIFVDNLQDLFGNQEQSESIKNELRSQLNRFAQLERHHILFVASSTNFRALPENLCQHQQFNCIPFTHPNPATIRKILKDKGRHLGFEENHVLAYHDRVKEWNVRDIATFLSIAHRRFMLAPDRRQALRYAYAEIVRAYAESIEEPEDSYGGGKAFLGVCGGVALAAIGYVLYSPERRQKAFDFSSTVISPSVETARPFLDPSNRLPAIVRCAPIGRHVEKGIKGFGLMVLGKNLYNNTMKYLSKEQDQADQE